MAESFVQLDPDGTGKKLHSYDKIIGVNTVHDEVVILGELYLPVYSVLHGGTSVATTGDHVAQLMAGASLKLRVRRITVVQDTLAGAAAQLKLEIRRLTSAGTGGNAGTGPNAYESTDPGAGATTQARPTTKGTEGVVLWEMAIPLVAAHPITARYEWVADAAAGIKPIVIPAGTANGLCLKVQTGVASATVETHIEFSESNF